MLLDRQNGDGEGGRKGEYFFPFQSLCDSISLLLLQSSFWCSSGSYTTAVDEYRKAIKEEKSEMKKLAAAHSGLPI